MDIVSHILIGKILSFNKKKKAQFWAMFFSLLPDLSQIPFYLVLGYENARPFLFPLNSDWIGARQLHPILSALWEAPHSLFFAILIILPIIIFFKLPKIAFFSYVIHLIVDIPTHSGEWAIKIFYPIDYTINGFTDAWAWPVWGFILSWIILISIVIVLNRFLKLKNDNSSNPNRRNS